MGRTRQYTNEGCCELRIVFFPRVSDNCLDNEDNLISEQCAITISYFSNHKL